MSSGLRRVAACSDATAAPSSSDSFAACARNAAAILVASARLISSSSTSPSGGRRFHVAAFLAPHSSPVIACQRDLRLRAWSRHHSSAVSRSICARWAIDSASVSDRPAMPATASRASILIPQAASRNVMRSLGLPLMNAPGMTDARECAPPPTSFPSTMPATISSPDHSSAEQSAMISPASTSLALIGDRLRCLCPVIRYASVSSALLLPDAFGPQISVMLSPIAMRALSIPMTLLMFSCVILFTAASCNKCAHRPCMRNRACSTNAGPRYLRGSV